MKQDQSNQKEPNYTKLIFKGRKPGIKKFIKYVNDKNNNNVDDCYEFYYRMALTEWDKLNSDTQKFLFNMVRYNRQRFLSYLFDKTVMGKLRSPVNHPVATAIVIIMHESLHQDLSFTRRGFGFSYCLSFCPAQQVEGGKTCSLCSIGYIKNLFNYHYLDHPTLDDLRDHLDTLQKESEKGTKD